jgi:8-hydroxy-5-deazaflavin:NADPH oxidoreductase
VETDHTIATPAAPTIVLVHGAFADASGFGGVTSRRQTAGRTVVAPPNPLPSLAFDTGAIAACVDAIAGPMVLVGHSYGGAVIIESSATLDTVRALAYLAAFSPNKCERCARVQDPFRSPLASTSDPTSHDTPGAPQRPDLIITKEQFRETFCADVPIDVTEVMFATQRPLSLAALTGKATAVVRKSKPSWYLVHAHGNAIPPDAERFIGRTHERHNEIHLRSAYDVHHPTSGGGRLHRRGAQRRVQSMSLAVTYRRTGDHAEVLERVAARTWSDPDVFSSLLEGSAIVFNSIGLIGSGPIAQALAHHLVAAQIPTNVSNSRGPDSLTDLVADLGSPARAVTVEQAAKADLVILALPFVRIPELAQVVPDWTGRTVVDATNEFAHYTPAYSGQVDLGGETSSEWVARHLPGATIIKAFNTMSSSYLAADPRHHDGRQVVFYAGDNSAACADFDQLISGLGYAPVHVGGLRQGGKLMQLRQPLSLLHVIKQD